MLTSLDHNALVQSTRSVLTANRVHLGSHRYTRPAPGTYEQLWLWDSCFHAIALRHYDIGMAWDELHAILAHQVSEGDDEGMVPHMTYWRGGGAMLWGNPNRSIITQPPLIALAASLILVAARASGSEASALAHLAGLYPKLVGYHNWFDRRRDVMGNGLSVLIHPWETGLDASPRWDAPMGFSGDDTRAVNAHSGRPDPDSAHYYANAHDNRLRGARIALAHHIRERGCNARELCDAGSFCVAPVDFNSLRSMDLCAMVELARSVGQERDVPGWLARIERLRGAVQSTFFSGDDLIATEALPGRAERLGYEDGIAQYLALAGNCATGAQANRLAERLRVLLDDASQWPISTTPTHAHAFAPRRYWRGNVWVQLNWLVWMGLKRRGFEVLAKRLAERTVALLHAHGLHEYFDPITGTGHGSSPHSWNAIVVDMMQ